jgi:hypothetical protein
VAINIIQRQLVHTDLGSTGTYLQGIDPSEIIDAVRSRHQPAIFAIAGLTLRPPTLAVAARRSGGRPAESLAWTAALCAVRPDAAVARAPLNRRRRWHERRWTLYEAAQSATRRQSRGYAHYHALRASGMTHTRVP